MELSFSLRALIGEPSIDGGAEAAAIAAIVGDLAGPAIGVTAGALRRVCGALLGSPQLLLQGVAGRGGERPLMTPTNAATTRCARGSR